MKEITIDDLIITEYDVDLDLAKIAGRAEYILGENSDKELTHLLTSPSAKILQKQQQKYTRKTSGGVFMTVIGLGVLASGFTNDSDVLKVMGGINLGLGVYDIVKSAIQSKNKQGTFKMECSSKYTYIWGIKPQCVFGVKGTIPDVSDYYDHLA